jgi:DNA-binding MarR family transcriptional regulator
MGGDAPGLADGLSRHARERSPATRVVLLSEKDAEDAARLMKLLTAGSEARVVRAASNDSVEVLTRAQLVQAALRELDVRRRRADIFPEGMFGEPAWEILLLLYVEDQRERLNIGRICSRLGIPMSSALRWLGFLQEAQLVRREPNPTDQRAILVRLTPRAIEVLDLYFSETLATEA